MKNCVCLLLMLSAPCFAVINQLDTEVKDDVDITTSYLILTDIPDGSNDMLCQAYVKIGGAGGVLDGTGGNFELIITVDGFAVQPSPQVITFGTETASSVWTTQFPVPTGLEVKLYVQSPNAADSAVDVTAYLYDVLPINITSGIVDADSVLVASVTPFDSSSDEVLANIVKVQGDAVTDNNDGLLEVNVEEIEDADPTDTIADAVWDEPLTGAGGGHNTANTAGKRLRQIEHASVLREEEQAQGGTSSTITLHNDASSINDFYNNSEVVIIGDTGIGQSRHIHGYVGSSRIASITPDWVTNPDATSDYVIMTDSEKHVHEMDDGSIAAVTFAADVDAEIAAYIWNALTSGYGGTGSYGQAVEDMLADILVLIATECARY